MGKAPAASRPQNQPQQKPDKNRGVRFMATEAIRAVEGEGNERRFIISFSSEEPYNRWFGPEILDHKAGAVDLERLNSIGVLLFNHDTDKVMGKVIRAWLENSRGQAEVEFDTDADAETIFQKVKSGTLKGVSVRYAVSIWEEVMAGEKSSDGRFSGPCSIATSWTPLEVSIVSVPADATVGVGRDMGEDEATPAPSNSGRLTLRAAQRQLQINKNYL